MDYTAIAATGSEGKIIAVALNEITSSQAGVNAKMVAVATAKSRIIDFDSKVGSLNYEEEWGEQVELERVNKKKCQILDY